MDVYAFLSSLIFAAAPEWGFMCFVSIRCCGTLIYPSPRVFSGGVSVKLVFLISMVMRVEEMG